MSSRLWFSFFFSARDQYWSKNNQKNVE
jgi:hypothetical protein